MPRYGILTQKRSQALPRFSNRWWTNDDSLAGAQNRAAQIAAAEMLMFSEDVTVYNTHVWLPGADPNVFSNVPRTLQGQVATVNALPPFLVAEFIFGTESSYLAYKYFRVQVDDDTLQGRAWTVAYQATLIDAAEAFSDILDFLVDGNGVAYTSVAFNQLYMPRQLHPRWYNRKSSQSGD